MKSPMMKKMISSILMVLFLFMIALRSSPLLAQKKVLSVNTKAPNIVLFDMNEKLFNLRKADYKNYILISFSATYCMPCKEEIKEFHKMMGEFPEDKVKIMLVFVDKNKDDIQKYIKANSVKVPIIHDVYQIAMKNYGVSSLPTSFLIDNQGVIRFVSVGYKEENISTIKKIVKK